MPAWIIGCNVLTLPSRISSNLVNSDIDTLAIFLDDKNFAVPPVERII